MVFFSCNACGESLKKNKVGGHGCAGATLSCIDCGVEFKGEEYVKHVKCVTEKEKYAPKSTPTSGPTNGSTTPADSKGVVGSDAAGKKGDWEAVLHAAIDSSDLTPSVKSTLIERIHVVPKKLAQFQNFWRNSKLRNSDISAAEAVFSVAHAEYQKSRSSKGHDDKNAVAKTQKPAKKEGNDGDEAMSASKKRKHRKRKRKETDNDAEGVEDVVPLQSIESEDGKKTKKHKKRTHKKKKRNVDAGDDAAATEPSSMDDA